MKVFVLHEDGTPISETEDIPPEKWMNDFVPPEMRQGGKIIEHIDPEDPERLLFTNQIRVSLARILACPDDAPFEQKAKVVGDLLHKCCFYWITGVMAEFAEKAHTHNGYVKVGIETTIFEYGWIDNTHSSKDPMGVLH